MITIINNNTEPMFNLALEEYLLKEYPFTEDILLIWRNDKSVIMGRNQNPWNEINLLFTEQHDIPVLRRISGGGTVVHDLGNINYSFISNDTTHINDYEYFLSPIISVLNSTGLKAKFVEKSHIYVDDFKISGNAQALSKSKMIHHGTILFDSDLDFVSNCIKKIPFIEGHFVKSDRAKIKNIKDLLFVSTNIQEFMEYIRAELLHNDLSKIMELSNTDLKRVNSIKQNKYASYEWNFGKSFKYEDEAIYLKIKKGVISDSSIGHIIGKKFLPKDLKQDLAVEIIHKLF